MTPSKSVFILMISRNYKKSIKANWMSYLAMISMHAQFFIGDIDGKQLIIEKNPQNGKYQYKKYQLNQSDYKVQMQNQLQVLLCGAYFAACGFQSAEKSTIPATLKKIKPDGGTAMRDSLIQGCKLMLKLNQVLKQMEADSHWNFVHVILTDGDDCNSKSSLQDAAKMMILIGKLIQVKSLKIIFIGVGVEEKAEKELQLLAAVGGQNAEYYNVNSSDIGNIFNKIEIGLGIERNIKMMGLTTSQGKAVFLQQENKPYLQVSVKNFAVMFNLDVSGSMSGNKWSNVCDSVTTFISKLGSSDLVSGLVFNDQSKLISNIKEDDKLFAHSSANKVNAISNNTKINFNVSQAAKKEEDCTIM